MIRYDELVKRLRTSDDLRLINETAKQLEQMNNTESHEELYRMARGEVRKRITFVPYFPFVLFFRRYNKEHISIGIRALAETGMPEAKSFLEELLQNSVSETDGRRVHSYPNVSKELGLGNKQEESPFVQEVLLRIRKTYEEREIWLDELRTRKGYKA